jgi:alanyl-tRNA synthetase/REP element-mobilizing transposase RayT
LENRRAVAPAGALCYESARFFARKVTMKIMTSAEIRQSFLDFFKSRQHAIVPSSSLLPDSPNLLFTNAGMNQFVPIFLGQQPCPYKPGRAADTQKCIRTGGKHNDLEDVGVDTYHHTFFEMLGNWSFGDYFKKDAIEWAWELLTQVWHFPPARLFATVYAPDKSKNDPSEFDQEAYDIWAGIFTKAGLDPKVHIVNGNKKDNFWMMGETGPCGPCSEIHIDLTPGGDTHGSLVNKGSAECIEIWNLVFMQFNANADGTFVPLPAQNVDTGMGFERVSGIIQGTKGFSDFVNAKISNYESDVFFPMFDLLERLSGCRYGHTMPAKVFNGHLVPEGKDELRDVAFRVIADHIRTLSFAIADGILPGNTDRNYVLRRILRRAVRYGRALGFREPFFYKLVDTLAEKMGDIFSEIRAKKDQVQAVIRTEEEAFNRTLDRGIEMFNAEVETLLRGAHAPSRAADRAPAVSTGTNEAKYSRRNLPHFERPWAKYAVAFSTTDRQLLAPAERDLVMQSVLYAHEHRQYELYAACVMPDHVHLLFEPQVKTSNEKGEPVFWSVSEILQGIKSASAHAINKHRGDKGAIWQSESFDRLIRSDSDLQEKFHYICGNPWENNVVKADEDYGCLWTPGMSAAGAPPTAREGACAPRILGDFAFKLYDTYGFPLDLTELMARERGLTVDTAGFEKLMAEQKARARAAQKKEIIEVSQIDSSVTTKFIGFDQLTATVKVQDVLTIKGRTAVILDATTCYAEMGGQVGDVGELEGHGQLWRIVDTQKAGNAWLHFLESAEAPAAGQELRLAVDVERRAAIQRHHTATHLLHWALHKIVSPDAVQKGSFVGPEKLTFDFSSAALTPAQLVEIERTVNARIVENAPVLWREVPYAEIKTRKGIRQFFGEKYGEVVRVVQVGGQPAGFDGYSMELCGGTHVARTGDIGQFRIVAESSVSAGIRRIEAVCGLAAWEFGRREHELLHAVSQQLSSAPEQVPGRVEALAEQVKKLEKELKQKSAESARGRTDDLIAKAQQLSGLTLIAADAGALDADALRGLHDGIREKRPDDLIVLGGAADGKVSFIASAPEALCKRGVHCGKLIGAVAKIAGGGGGGRPDKAQAGGKDPSKVAEAIAKVAELLGPMVK